MILRRYGRENSRDRPSEKAMLSEKRIYAIFRYCISGIIASGIKDIVIVIGPGSKELFNAINGFPLRVAFSEDSGSEMADSVRTGLRQIGPSATGVVICLSDHPMVTEETFRDLVKLHGECPDKILIPVYKGKKGHPTLFPASVANEMFSGLNLRQLIDRLPGRVNFLEVQDEGVILDMDTMDDYRIILEKIRARRQGHS